MSDLGLPDGMSQEDLNQMIDEKVQEAMKPLQQDIDVLHRLVRSLDEPTQSLDNNE